MSNATRLEEAIIYLARECAELPRFGMTKMYKALIIADILAKSTLGETVTRWKYLRFEKAPVPVDAHRIIDEHEFLSILEIPVHNKTMKRIVAHREPDLSVFSDEEVNLLQMAIGIVSGHTADGVSELSHGIPAWRWTEPDKVIDEELLKYPYLIKSSKASGEMLDYANESLKAQGIV
ncbi:MAG: hypothetical protein IIC97_02055 [Chloroflexi bacterium]|nr:hypothetical protein [Chloroflexota bacterium]